MYISSSVYSVNIKFLYKEQYDAHLSHKTAICASRKDTDFKINTNFIAFLFKGDPVRVRIVKLGVLDFGIFLFEGVGYVWTSFLAPLFDSSLEFLMIDRRRHTNIEHSSEFSRYNVSLYATL